VTQRILAWLAIPLLLASPAVAAADLSCSEWRRLGPEQKAASVQGMIEGHLGSNAGKRFTSENKAAMRRCLSDFAPRIVDDMDDVCSDVRTAGPGAIDDVFDRYLLSCVQ
jgi:hypothetical protein